MDDFDAARLEEELHRRAGEYIRRAKLLQAALSPEDFATWLVGYRAVMLAHLTHLRAPKKALRRQERSVAAAVEEAIRLREKR